MNDVPEAELADFLKQNKKVVVDFYTPTCVPCKILMPVVTQVSSDPAFVGVQFVKVSLGGNADPTKWDVQSVPAVVGFVNGSEVSRSVGICAKKVIAKVAQTVLDTNP
jgi:thioredoxin 1